MSDAERAARVAAYDAWHGRKYGLCNPAGSHEWEAWCAAWQAGIAHERARAAEAQRLREYALTPWELERYDNEVERLEGEA